MIISVAKMAKEQKLKLPDLITRPGGHGMYESIRTQIDLTGADETVIMDFEGVKVIDSSFIDELIVSLILESRTRKPPFFLKLRNISDIAEINIDLVFRTYSSYNSRRIVVVTDNICRNHNFFIGQMSPLESDVIEYLRINKSASFNDILGFTGAPAESVAAILEELYSLRAVKKQGESSFCSI